MKVNKMTLSEVVPVEFHWLGKIKQGVKTFLESKLMKWDARAQGIIKNFCKIRIISKKARILEDVGIVLIPVRYTLNLYSPKTGDTLEGIVKNWSGTEIGALVDCFNTIILPGSCKFDQDMWKDLNNVEVKRDCKVSFVLEKYFVYRIETIEGMLRFVGSNPIIIQPN